MTEEQGIQIVKLRGQGLGYKQIAGMVNLSRDSVRSYCKHRGLTGYVEPFGGKKISTIKVSDAKLFLIKLQQEDGRGYSSIHTIRGVLRPAFQMAVDDDVLHKNPFGFELAGVIVNDSVTREAVSRDVMRKFLKFVHDDNVYCKYYEVVYILFHTGMRISEFCGLTIKDIDFENNVINIDHQLLRTSEMKYKIEATKTNAEQENCQ